MVMNTCKVNVGIGKLKMHLQSSQARILIKGGTVVNHNLMEEADVYIEGDKIKEVGHNLFLPGGVKVIDASGKYIIPGGIDTHVNFQSNLMGTPTAETFYSGTRAALAGGTTMIIDTVVCRPAGSLLKAYEEYREAADNQVCCDYALHSLVPRFDDQVAHEMETLVKEKGINSFTAFMSHRGMYMLEDDELYDLLKKCQQLGALAQIHAENGKVIERLANEIVENGITGPEGYFYSRPSTVESEATERAIGLAKMTNCPLLLLHVTHREAAMKVADAKRDGDLIFGESILAALAAEGSHYFNPCWRHAAGYVLSPPLPTDPSNRNYLMKLLSSSNLDCVASHDCVYRADQKALGKDDFRKIPPGVNGVEDRMSLIWEKGVETGILDPCKFVAVTSTNAAKLFNLYPRKGCIAAGSDADVVIWGPKSTRIISSQNHHQSVDFNVFEGIECHGVPHVVITGGHIVLEEAYGVLHVSQGVGKFVSTLSHSPYVYGTVNIREQFRLNMPVSREPYSGPVFDVLNPVVFKEDVEELPAAPLVNGSEKPPEIPQSEFHNRPPTRSGGRNMQDSSFALSGARSEENPPIRSNVRRQQPPGGVSTNSLW